MKKSSTIILALTLTLIMSSSATLAIEKTHTVNSNKSEPLTLVTDEPKLVSPANQLPSKDENVYAVTKHNGNIDKLFVNSTVADAGHPLPIALQITYYLDGQEISASDLSGKSGHTKITYHFESTKSYQNKLIPFLSITGLELDTNKFTNIKISNGKILKESSNTTILAGYALIGLNENFNTNLFPNSFTIEADVKDFQLSTAYTLVTNEIFTDLDISRISSIDAIIGQINQLSSALNQIIAGSSELAGGLDAAFSGAKQLQSGAVELNHGAHELAAGATAIDTGAHELAAGAAQLSDGLSQITNINNTILTKINSVASVIKSRISTLNELAAEITTTNPELAAKINNTISQLSAYYDQIYNAITSYTGGIAALADGAKALQTGAETLASGTSELKNGANALANGTDTLTSGTNTLVDGLSQLASGGHTLNSGLATFKQQGIDKLVNFANQDLDAFTRNLRQTINAAKNYHSYQNPSATSVKFFFKTPSI